VAGPVRALSTTCRKHLEGCGPIKATRQEEAEIQSFAVKNREDDAPFDELGVLHVGPSSAHVRGDWSVHDPGSLFGGTTW